MSVRRWSWFLGYHERPVALVAVAVVTSAGSSAALLGVALLVRYALGTVIPSGDALALAGCVLGIFGLVVANALVRTWSMRWTFGALKWAIQQLREDLLRHLYALPRSVHTTLEIGRVHGVIVQGTGSLDGLSYALLGQLIPGAIVSAALGAILVVLDWRLGLVMLGLVPVLVVLARSIGSRLKGLVRSVARAAVELSNGTLFALEALDLTRARGSEALELERQKKTFDTIRRATHETVWLQQVYRMLQENSVALFVIATVFVAGLAASQSHGRISVNEIVVVYVVLTLMRSHLADVWASIPTIVEGFQALEDVHDLFLLDGKLPYNGARPVALAGRVRLEDVSFGYGTVPVFEGVNLETAPGRVTAIVGRNGAGKTTIGNLILGFYKPSRGALSAEGVPYDEIDLVALRRAIGFVPQEPFLFSGTVRENLIYGTSAATESEITTAAHVATLNEVTAALPQGMETKVGEGARLLSGGQRQRIAIARALLGDPRLLILDEPTHNLDHATTATLLANLKRLAAAILIFTHDEAVVRNADEVYRIEGGRLARVAPGTVAAAATVG